MTNWISRTAGKSSGAPVAIDEDLLDEEVIFFMQGKNSFGDAIYSYVLLTLRNLQRLKKALDEKVKFHPSDFGTVVAAGKGVPSDELRAEMAATYNMVDLPAPTSVALPQPPVQPKLWDDTMDEEEGESGSDLTSNESSPTVT